MFVGIALVPLAASPWGYNPFGPAKLLLTFVTATLACAWIAVDAAGRSRVGELAGRPLVLAASAALAAAILSLVTTADVRVALVGAYPGYVGIVAGIAWLTVGMASAAMDWRAARTAIGRAAAVAILPVATVAVLQAIGVDPLGVTGERVGSLLGNASNLGVWVAIVAPLIAETAGRERGPWRAVAWTALGAVGITSTLAASRGGWLGLALALGIWLALGWRHGEAGTAPASTRRARVLAVLTVAGWALTAIALAPGAPARAVGGGTAADTAEGRVAVWEASRPLVAERPVLGWGVGAFGRVFGRYATAATVDPSGRSESLDDPHNLILSTAATTGALGVLALAGLMLAAVVTVMRALRTGAADWAGALGAAFAGGFGALQFHFITLETGMGLAVVLGALAAAGYRSDAAEVPSPRERRHARIVRLAAVAVALLLAVAGVAAAGMLGADGYVRRGFDAASAGEWRSAGAAFGRASALAPWEPAIAWAEGRAALAPVTATGDPAALARGRQALAAAAAAMPGDARPLRDLGDLLVAASVHSTADPLWVEAEAAYDRALMLAPLDARALLGRGVARAAQQEAALAEADLLRSVELAPGFAPAWQNLAELYLSLGRDAEAEQAAARAAALAAQP